MKLFDHINDTHPYRRSEFDDCFMGYERGPVIQAWDRKTFRRVLGPGKLSMWHVP